MKILSYRSTMPFQNRGPNGMPSISPTTDKSVMPANNVPTILDVLNGVVNIRDLYPGTRGNWAPGEDVDKSYKDPGSDYKRLERDWNILQEMSGPRPPEEQWKVKVPGGSKIFPSFPLAQKYKEKLKNKGIRSAYLARVAQTDSNSDDRVEVIATALTKTFMVESINAARGVVEHGAAFCIHPNHFITCAHVLKSYDKYNIDKKTEFASDIVVSIIQGGKKYRAVVVAVDPYLDIALLKAEVSATPFILDPAFAVGEEVIAIGSPHGYENNVSVGNVGSIQRRIYQYRGAPSYSFIDLAIFPGNSGGPVIKESNGQVIGMVTLVVSAEGGYGLNASLPSSYIVSFCESNIADFNASPK